MGYVTTRKLGGPCGFTAFKAAESFGAADDTADLSGISRQRKQLFYMHACTLETISGLKGLSPDFKHAKRFFCG